MPRCPGRHGSRLPGAQLGVASSAAEARGSCGRGGTAACYRVGAPALPNSPAASRLFLRGGFWMGVFFRGVSGTGAPAAAFSAPGASGAGGTRASEAGSTERLAFCGGAGFSRGPCAPGVPSARPRLRVLSRSSAASMEAASGALRGGPPASVGSERPGPRPRARARGGEGAARAGPSSASPGGRGVGSRARGLPGSSGRADVSLGVRFLLLGLGAASRPSGGGEGARAAVAVVAPCLPWIQDTLGLVAGSGGGGFLRSGDGERDRPPASPRARAGRASRRATRAYSAPPGPSTLDADRSLSEDAGRGAASSEDAGVVTDAADGTCASAGAAGTSTFRPSVAASSWGTQYTGPSSVVSKEEKEAREDHDGEGCSSPEGGSRKLQLSVLSRSWWATTTLGSFCLRSGIRGNFMLMRLNRPHSRCGAFFLPSDSSRRPGSLPRQAQQQPSSESSRPRSRASSAPAPITPLRWLVSRRQAPVTGSHESSWQLQACAQSTP